MLRDGSERALPVEEVVPGDVIVLRPGCAVPADARVLEAYDLSLDESALTGESVPVGKQVSALGEANLALDQRNTLFTRVEFVRKSNADLAIEDVPASSEHRTSSVSLGYLRELGAASVLSFGVGARVLRLVDPGVNAPPHVLHERAEQPPVQRPHDERWVNHKSSHRASPESFTTFNVVVYND